MELILSVGALAVVIGFAMVRPRGWPEAVIAVPAAAMLIAARQGMMLRERVGMNAQLHDTLAAMYADLGQRIAPVEEDRTLDGELRQLLQDIRAQSWELYADE